MTSQDHSGFDRAIRLHIYYHFATVGRPPTTGETARVLNRDANEIAEAYQRLAAGRVLVLNPGTLDIRMANPLSAIPTQHRVEAIGREWYASCVWDALGVIAMFGGTGTVLSECGDCGEPMRLRVENGELVERAGVIHFALAAAHWWDDIIFT